jgi:hypothetical protein
MVPDHLAQLSVGLRVGDQEVDVGISDRVAGQRLRRALEGKGAFRRFRNVLYERHPDLISVWHVMREARPPRAEAALKPGHERLPGRPGAAPGCR